MKIELDGRKYNLDKLGGAKAALRRVEELKAWVKEGNDLAFDVEGDVEEPTQEETLKELTALIALLRERIRAAKKVRKQAKKDTPQKELTKTEKKTKQAEKRMTAVDKEISRLMIVRMGKEAEEDAILTLLLS